VAKKPADKKTLLTEFMSLFNPELTRALRKLAESIPADSFIRSDTFGRFMGPLSKWLEGKEEGLGPIAGAFVEKAADTIQDFASVVQGTEKKTAPEAMDGEAWINGIAKGAAKRLEKAANPAAEAAKIIEELAAMQSLIDAFKAHKAATAPPPAASKPVTHLLRDDAIPAVRDLRTRIAAAARRRRGTL